MAHLWGIDLGGTKIEGAILDPADPEHPICRLRVPTEADKGYEHVLGQILKVCDMIQAETGLPLPERIGMGTPGIIDPQTGKLKNSNSQCLNGRTLQIDLEARKKIKFILANDANCFAMAEAAFGAGRGFPTVFGVILGTGVGGGIVVNGHVLSGCHGIAGEWGQLILDPTGPTSNYGTYGTVEAFVAGPALERFYAECTGRHLKLKEIAERAANKSDPNAIATIERLTDCLAKALGMVVNMLDPHAIILGGGVGNIDVLYTGEMRRKISAAIFNTDFVAALLRPKLGDSAGVFGAAMLTR